MNYVIPGRLKAGTSWGRPSAILGQGRGRRHNGENALRKNLFMEEEPRDILNTLHQGIKNTTAKKSPKKLRGKSGEKGRQNGKSPQNIFRGHNKKRRKEEGQGVKAAGRLVGENRWRKIGKSIGGERVEREENVAFVPLRVSQKKKLTSSIAEGKGKKDIEKAWQKS